MTEALTTPHSDEPAIDGRVARRQRNLDAVLDVVQIGSIDQLRRSRNLTVAEADVVLRDALTSLLSPAT